MADAYKAKCYMPREAGITARISAYVRRYCQEEKGGKRRSILRGQLPHWNRMKASIQQNPRVGEVFWIGNPRGIVEPEFTGCKPGVIFRVVETYMKRQQPKALHPSHQ